MATALYQVQPVVGMTLTFTPAAEAALAGIPATVVYVWPRFRSGAYLVTLEYAQSVKFRNELIRHIDAFMSELEQPTTGAERASTDDGVYWASHMPGL